MKKKKLIATFSIVELCIGFSFNMKRNMNIEDWSYVSYRVSIAKSHGLLFLFCKWFKMLNLIDDVSY